jgi:UDP-N-acetylglucosamine pyrophosphorylase
MYLMHRFLNNFNFSNLYFILSDSNDYLALLSSGALADMKSRNVELVSQYCVDNSLVKILDPTFVGYCYAKNADCAAKVVGKAYPDEPGT